MREGWGGVPPEYPVAAGCGQHAALSAATPATSHTEPAHRDAAADGALARREVGILRALATRLPRTAFSVAVSAAVCRGVRLHVRCPPPCLRPFLKLRRAQTEEEVAPETLEKRFNAYNKDQLNFMKQCLKYEPEHRCTCSELMQHPYFTEDGFVAWFDGELKQMLDEADEDKPLLSPRDTFRSESMCALR